MALPRFAEDQFKLTSWLTLECRLTANAFLRWVTENATDPRVGGSLRIPKINWVFRAILRALLPGAAAGHDFRASF